MKVDPDFLTQAKFLNFSLMYRKSLKTLVGPLYNYIKTFYDHMSPHTSATTPHNFLKILNMVEIFSKVQYFFL